MKTHVMSLTNILAYIQAYSELLKDDLEEPKKSDVLAIFELTVKAQSLSRDIYRFAFPSQEPSKEIP